MDDYISKDVNLPELYKYALTEALQINFTLTEEAIDRIHRDILRELETKCKNLVKEGLVTNEDISRNLDYQVAPILQEAKRVNKKRIFSWNAEKIKGLYNGFPYPVYDYEVVEGGDNDAVVGEIRRWLCDFNNFSSRVKGCWETVGCNYDEVKEDLQVQKLLPGILTSNKTSRSINDVKVNLLSHIIIHPIEMKLFAHDPNAVEMVTEDLTLSTWKMKCSITKQGIRRSISDEGNIEFVFPCYPKVNVNSTVEADIEFKATKECKVRTWALVFSFGISSAFNTCKSKKFVHRVKLNIRTPDTSVKLREPVTIEISKEQAERFMKHHNHFRDIISATAGPQDNTAPSLLPGETFITMHERFPWLLFVLTLRRGDAKAAMEIVKKKPEVFRNLPGNENNVLGITFEELQIAKIMAEAIGRNVPIELMAGHGQLRYNGREIKTPNYADAVFRNTKTGEYFSVRFKYTDEATDLIDMMQRWHIHWRGNPDNANYPEDMRLENVILVGPNDVVNAIKERNIDIGDQVRSNFQHSEIIGFKYPNDETETMRTFLRDNEKLLKYSSKYGIYKRKIIDVSQMKKDGTTANHEQTRMINESEMKTKEESWRAHFEEHLTCRQKPTTRAMLKKAALNVVKNCKYGIYKRKIIDVSQMKKDGTTANHEQTRMINESEMKTKEESWRAHFEEHLTCRQKPTTRAMLKKAALNVVKNCKMPLVKVLKKEKVIAIAKSHGPRLIPPGLKMGGKFGTASGFAYAGALTLASKVTSPIVIVGLSIAKSYDIIKHWNAGDITKAEMQKEFGRFTAGNLLSTGGMMVSGFVIGGPLGLMIGTGLAIAIVLGDHFLGDKIWSKVRKEDPKEARAVMERKINALSEDVLQDAYDILDITEYSTREEIKGKYRIAILKYHPDKGGSAETFLAVHAAYAYICNARHFYCER